MLKEIKFNHIVNNDIIHVSSTCTDYVKINNISLIDFDILKQQVKILKTLCKDKNIKINGLTKQLKFIKDNKEQYTLDIKEYNRIFSILKNKWSIIISNKVYAPTSNNEDLKHATRIRWTLEGLTRRNTLITKYRLFYNSVNNNIKDIVENTEKVYIQIGF